ncbi:hypothetical protein GCM10009037_07150 [Halarchaeum grantii]|uniref:Uncharacterized protein n=1 Tax=Halarchaeum grantii TaxID=1193105 RepID=A0A830ESK9_9EURY|nr:hypothetical protein [Halarchaeum grantii]GGL26100.1 hypothetical protein GCM10009037_07150 [Halarchaeum grantii]
MPSMVVWAALGVLATFVAASFVWDYLREDRELEDAATRTGERAQRTVKGAAKGSRLAVVGLAGLGASVAAEMLQFAGELNAVLGGAPVLIGHLIFGMATFAGLKGLIPFDVETMGFVFIFVTAIALILRYGSAGEGS